MIKCPRLGERVTDELGNIIGLVKTEARSPRTSGNVDEGIGKEVRWRFHRKYLASALDWLKCSHPFLFVFAQKFSRIGPVKSSVFGQGRLSHAARSQLCSQLVPRGLKNALSVSTKEKCKCRRGAPSLNAELAEWLDAQCPLKLRSFRERYEGTSWWSAVQLLPCAKKRLGCWPIFSQMCLFSFFSLFLLRNIDKN